MTRVLFSAEISEGVHLQYDRDVDYLQIRVGGRLIEVSAKDLVVRSMVGNVVNGEILFRVPVKSEPA